MKKLILTFVSLVLFFSAFAQEKTFKSSFTNSLKSEYETKEIYRNITINDQQIKISNFLNGGKDELVLKVDKIEKKEYSWDGMCIWYYCQKENNSDKRKYIVRIKDIKYLDEINIYTFQEEVNVYHSIILVDK